MTEKTKAKWKIDPGHSEVQFKVKHLSITNVNGTFDLFQGDVQTDNDEFQAAEIHFEIQTESINTNNELRDKHLRSPELFDTQKFPKIIFEGRLNKKTENYELVGELTMRGIARLISMEAVFAGSGMGRFNDLRAGFEVDGKINRRDFGIDWNILRESGGLVVGDEIKLHFDIQLIKQSA